MLPLGDIIDINQEKIRLNSQRDEFTKSAIGIEGRLNNKNFTKKAPAHVVESDRQRLVSLKEKIEKLDQVLNGLE